MAPDTTMRTAGLIAAGASTMLNTLVNGYGTPSMFHHTYGWGNDNDNVNGTPSIIHHVNDNVNDNVYHQSEHLNKDQAKSDKLYKRYTNKITTVIYKRGKDVLYDLYGKNEKFSGDLVKYIRNNLAQRNEQILDKRCNYITFDTLGYEYLDECFKSKDHSKNLFKL